MLRVTALYASPPHHRIFPQRLCLSASLSTAWDVERIEAAERELQRVPRLAAVSGGSGSGGGDDDRAGAESESFPSASPDLSSRRTTTLQPDEGQLARRVAVLRQAASGGVSVGDAGGPGATAAVAAPAHPLASTQQWIVSVGAPAAHALGFKGGAGAFCGGGYKVVGWVRSLPPPLSPCHPPITGMGSMLQRVATLAAAPSLRSHRELAAHAAARELEDVKATAKVGLPRSSCRPHTLFHPSFLMYAPCSSARMRCCSRPPQPSSRPSLPARRKLSRHPRGASRRSHSSQRTEQRTTRRRATRRSLQH